MKQKVIPLLLALCMILAVAPMEALAAEPSQAPGVSPLRFSALQTGITAMVFRKWRSWARWTLPVTTGASGRTKPSASGISW